MRKLTLLWLLTFALGITSTTIAQGIDTTANKDEWEEINFEPGSDVLVDGFPSLLREAELLSQHPEYRANVVGHGDGQGSRAAAEKLGMKRAEAIKAYLVKYGARPNQVQTSSVGDTDPKVQTKTKEGRFMNRRATTQLLNGQGQPVAACPCEGMKPLQDEIDRLRAAAQQAAAAAAAANRQQQDRINQLEGQLRDQTAARQATQQQLDQALQRLKDQAAELARQAEAFKGQVDAAAQKAAADAAAAAQRAADAAKISNAAGASAAAQNAAAQQAATNLKALQGDADTLLKDARDLQAKANAAGPNTSAADRAALEGQLNDLNKRLDDLRGRLAAETARSGAATSAATAEDAARKEKMPRFSLLGLNVGVDNKHDATFTGSGRFFAPFNRWAAAQIQGEYMYFTDRREAQGDIGLVNRWKDIQLGGFASFRNVWMKNMQATATMGQASFLADYLFGPGKMGIYGSKTFLNDGVINTASLGTGTAQIQTYLHAVDAIGVNGAIAVMKNNPKSPWLDGNVGWLKSGTGSKKAGGTIRFVYPLTRLLALTAEGGVNESLIGKGNNGRAVFGILFGQQTNPSQFRAADHPVPMLVPRVRYEMLTRRIGNDAPVANAGPDQIGIPAGTVRLDGSKSFDPNGDPITFSWTQLAGPAVALAGANTANPTFSAVAGQAYSFMLTVSDGTSSSSSRVAVTSKDSPRPNIVRFTANPATINAGQVSTLNWQVDNADTVTISTITQSLAKDSGTVNVSPTQTTNYVLTATNSAGQATAVAVVTVGGGTTNGAPFINSFTATPSSIVEGSMSTLAWSVTGADRITIDNGVGAVTPGNGNVQVSPAVDTTYTLTAVNTAGQVTGVTRITVNKKVKITSFTVTPGRLVVTPGSIVTFNWTTQNATTVTLEPGGGTRGLNGTVSLDAPASTRTYTLRATGVGDNNTDTATVTVTVDNPANGPQIVIPLSNFYTAFRNVQLDARGSFDPSGGTLTFLWTSVDGKADVLSPSSALTPVILKDAYYGDFVFEVKVTNSAGQTATRRVIVTLPVGGCGQNGGCVGNN